MGTWLMTHVANGSWRIALLWGDLTAQTIHGEGNQLGKMLLTILLRVFCLILPNGHQGTIIYHMICTYMFK